MDVFFGRGHTHKFKEVISGEFEYSRVNEEQGSSRMVLPDQEWEQLSVCKEEYPRGLTVKRGSHNSEDSFLSVEMQLLE
jgi:hypothetical protein